MNSKILNTIVPPITGLVDESYPLVVALSSDKPWPWFYSNYIQLALKNDDKMGYNVRFYKTDHRGIMWDTLNPWINYNMMNVNFLKELNMGIIDFVVRSINSGYYVSLFLDRFYVPGVRNYQNSHMTHEAMVFGYDLENEKINLMEYTGAYLTEFTITFSEFLLAYENSDLNRYEEIHLLKFDEQRIYEFDLINISEQLKDYLSSKNTSERYRINSNPVYSAFVTFGMDIYKDIRYLLDYNHLNYDIRVFNSVWEHKKVMAERVKYIVDNNYVENFEEFYEPCKDIENKSYLLKSQFMRLCATKNPAVLKTIYSLMDYMEDKERTVYGAMVERIDAQVEKNKIREEGAWYSECAFRSGTLPLEPIGSDSLAVDFDLIPENNVIDGVIGYTDSKSKVIAYSSMTFILKFNVKGYFEAMDGDKFRALTQVSYAKNKKYHVSIKADFVNKTYSISIHDGDNLHMLAEKFSFGIYVQEPTDIDKITLVVDNMCSFKVINHKMSV